MRWFVLLLGVAMLQDDEIDPADYKGPASAISVEVKVPAPVSRAYFGITGGEASEDGGIVLAEVPEEGPAGKAGLRAGDRLISFDGEEVKDINRLVALIGAKKPADQVAVKADRGGEELELTVTLGARRVGGDMGMAIWKKRTFSLAVVPFDFPDCAHNAGFAPADFERLLFSRGAYVKKSPTGDPVFGSLADYYAENSYGKLEVTGKCFKWVTLEKTRAYFEDRRMGDKEAAPQLLPKALELVKQRDGEDCFNAYDGIVFIYAGKQTYRRPWMLWPHRASIKAGARSIPYYLNAEGGRYFNAVGVHVHEFGHMLGLPDQYGRNHATGVGKWCTMAVGHMGGGESRNARPLHLCPWCKDRLGWVTSAAIEPATAQRLKLSAIEKDGTQVFKVLLAPDGTSCYYLENRQREGFDRDLEGSGLLVWRLRRGQLDLIEAHGRAVPNASLVETDEIPFPSLYNRHFTPDTTPSTDGSLYLTDIVAKDGTIYFTVGERKKVVSRAIEKRSDY